MPWERLSSSSGLQWTDNDDMLGYLKLLFALRGPEGEYEFISYQLALEGLRLAKSSQQANRKARAVTVIIGLMLE